MASIEHAEQRIEDLKGLRGGKLSLGASFPIGHLHSARKSWLHSGRIIRRSKWRWTYRSARRIVARILANKLDLGLVSHEVHDPRLLAKKFMTDELIAIVPRNHRWANKNRDPAPRSSRGNLHRRGQRRGHKGGAWKSGLSEKGIVLTECGRLRKPRGRQAGGGSGAGSFDPGQERGPSGRSLAAPSLGVSLAGMDARLALSILCRKDKHLSNAAQAFLALLRDYPASVAEG